jgi:hypothetical protein
MIDRIREIVDLQDTARNGGAPYLADPRLELEKWTLIYKHLRGQPFATDARLSRAEQWREAADQVRDLRELELLDWVIQQAEIAQNLERGIRDLRPRKDGPCHPLILDYVADRRRKAKAVLDFAQAGANEGLLSPRTGQ